MKKLTTTAGVFGPFAFIETLPDRYRCDGADLPFTVVGAGAVDDWTGPLPTPVPPSVPVPQAVTMRQARLALLAAGLLDTVQTAITSAGPAAKIEWEYAAEVQRNAGLVPAMATALGMTSGQIDALFIAAAAI